MTAIPLHPCTTTAADNAAEDATFLHLDDRLLTTDQVVLAPGSYLAKSGDNFHGQIDPIHMIITQIRYGDLHSWQQTQIHQDAAAVLTRVDRITRDYFGRAFPTVNVVSRP